MNGVTKQWFTADQHFGHRNILDGPDTWGWRKFASIDEMNDALIDAHNSVVDYGDVVYHLGDIFFHNSLTDYEKAVIIDRMNGLHFLIRGNHDYVNKWTPMVIDNFQWIEIRKEITIKGRGHVGNNLHLTLDHLPLETWYNRFAGALHLHGHCHNTMVSRPGRLDVGVDNAYKHFGEYRPFSLDEVLEILDAESYWKNQLPILRERGESAFANLV